MDSMVASSNNAKTVYVISGINPRPLYEHQVDAIHCLDKMDVRQSFRTMVVLPTGAGKTMTATTWLLRAAVDKNKKVLWLAHRHLLLEQAAEALALNAFSEVIIHRTSFTYRIVSGEHDRAIDIKPSDDVLIVGKDSITRNLSALEAWLSGVNELYLVIDEAHHATARSYRKIISHLELHCHQIKLLGLTATPFRTSEQEQGLLGKIFTDDIAYKIDLDTLIKKGILSKPYCEECETEVLLGSSLGLDAIRNIEHLDALPEDIATKIAENKERNHFIVSKFYKDDAYKKYGQTLIFALNRMHALVLKKLFEERGKGKGIHAGVIMSGTNAEFTGIDISDKENKRQIEAYRKGEVQVLINVNILTEGVDLPKTKTVFLTRPTVSMVLMTQMVGRALRGEKAGGTKDAYIVSFMDNWNSKIAWVNPESILLAEEGEFSDKDSQHTQRIMHIISIEKVEEFAMLMNDSVDTSRLETLDFIRRVPVGMYMFSFINDKGVEQSHQILVYDNSEHRYQDLLKTLPELFKEFGAEEEQIPTGTLISMLDRCEQAYFDHDMIPPYNRKDIECLLRYYAQKESTPLFVTIDDLDRRKLDISLIAKEVVEQDMRRSEQNRYIDELWTDESRLIKAFFGSKLFFVRQLEIEISKLSGVIIPDLNAPNVVGEKIDIQKLPLHEYCKHAPEQGRALKETVYEGAKTQDGMYHCAQCGYTSQHKGLFQIDHIKPMSKGGLTMPENLQLLCGRCNRRKGDFE